MSTEDTAEAPTTMVFDRLDQPVGSLRSWIRSERTGEPRALAIELDPDTRSTMGGRADTIEVGAESILSMRRDRITLDHVVSELGRFTTERDGAHVVADAANEAGDEVTAPATAPS